MSEDAKIIPMPDATDFNSVLLDFNDEPMRTLNSAKEEVPFTLGDACSQALIGNFEGDQKLDGKQRRDLWNLARKVQKSTNDDDWAIVKLNSTQKKRILDRVEKCFPTVVYARVYEALEGTTQED